MALNDSRHVGGAARLARRIETIRTTLALPPMMEAIGDLLVRRTLDRFEREVDPEGVPWKKLSPATIARRKRGGGKPGKKILQQTEDLKNAIDRIRGVSTGLVVQNTGAGFRIGVKSAAQTVKAAAHMYGTSQIPARRFLGIGSLDVKAVDGLMRRQAAKIGVE